MEPMFAEIIPHRRLPKNFESFTYEVPSGMKINPGQIVLIPLRRHILSGVVRSLHGKKPAYATKPVISATGFSLPEYQLKLAAWMAEFYCCALAQVLPLFFPEGIGEHGISALSEASTQISNAPPAYNAARNPHIEALLRRILGTPEKKLLFEKTPLPRAIFFTQLIAALQKNEQGLFLFPENFSLRTHAAQLCPPLPQFHGELKDEAKEALWSGVFKGAVPAVAGTRIALFLPYKKLSFIVVDGEHNENYLEKRTPRYHALEVAEKMAELLKIPLIAVSSTPRVETFHRSMKGDFEYIAWENSPRGGGAHSPGLARFSIIDMEDEYRKGNTELLPPPVIEKIGSALIKQKQTLLFINRRGEAGALFCCGCSNVLKCPRCSSPLAVHKENILKCHRCKLSQPMPPACPRCQSLRQRPLGAGTEKLEKEILKIFSKASVMRLDGETLGTRKKKLASFNPETLNAADIIVGTNIVDKPLELKRLVLSVALFPENMLNVPDFRAGERCFQLLTHLRHLTSGGEMVIQTLLPENELFKDIAANEPDAFYKKELEARKNLTLPPFGRDFLRAKQDC